MPCAAGELGLVSACTPKRPDGHECRGKCGGRLHGLCGEADPDCDNQCSASAMIALPPSDLRRARARRSSPRRESARRQTRAVLGRGHGRTQSLEQAIRTKKIAPRTRLSNAQNVEILGLLDRKVPHLAIADRYGCGPQTVSIITKKKGCPLRSWSHQLRLRPTPARATATRDFLRCVNKFPGHTCNMSLERFLSYMYLNAVCILNDSNVECSLDDSVQQLLVEGL